MPVLLPPLLITLGFAIRATLGASNLREGRFYRSGEWLRLSRLGLTIWGAGILIGAVWAVADVHPYDNLVFGTKAVLSAVVLVLLSPLLGGGMPASDPTLIYQAFALVSLTFVAAGVVLAAMGKQTRWGSGRVAKKAAQKRTRTREALVAFFNYAVALLLAHLIHEPYCHFWAAYCSNEALVATVVETPRLDARDQCQCSWPLRALAVRDDGPIHAVLDGFSEHKSVLADPRAPESARTTYRCLLGLVARTHGPEAEAALATIRSWKLAPWSEKTANSAGDFVREECQPR